MALSGRARARPARYRSALGRAGSVVAGADDLAAGPGDERRDDGDRQAVLGEVDRPVGEEAVSPAWKAKISLLLGQLTMHVPPRMPSSRPCAPARPE